MKILSEWSFVGYGIRVDTIKNPICYFITHRKNNETLEGAIERAKEGVMKEYNKLISKNQTSAIDVTKAVETAFGILHSHGTCKVEEQLRDLGDSILYAIYLDKSVQELVRLNSELADILAKDGLVPGVSNTLTITYLPHG